MTQIYLVEITLLTVEKDWKYKNIMAMEVLKM